MKKLIIITMLILVIAILTGCNMQVIDTTFSFDRAIVSLPDGSLVVGEVDSWRDYEGDQIQVVISGTTYLVHSTDIALIKD